MVNYERTDWTSLFNRLKSKQGADATTPAFSYPVFITETTKLFIEKSTDYEDRYIKGLIELDASTLWRWEVSKKLDRLRTWLKRGELLVKDEGVRNSVDDIFIYTVQYVDYVQRVVNNGDDALLYLSELQKFRRVRFEYRASRLTPTEWVWFLVNKGLIQDYEKVLQLLILSYMGHEITAEQWQEGIRSLLK